MYVFILFPGIEGQDPRQIIWLDYILAKGLRQKVLELKGPWVICWPSRQRGRILGSFREVK